MKKCWKHSESWKNSWELRKVRKRRNEKANIWCQFYLLNCENVMDAYKVEKSCRVKNKKNKKLQKVVKCLYG